MFDGAVCGVSSTQSLSFFADDELDAVSSARFAFIFFEQVVFQFIYASLGAASLVDTSEIPTESLFIRAFFFSVQTFATIGYGTIHPVGIDAESACDARILLQFARQTL